jgi:hypothetical protein
MSRGLGRIAQELLRIFKENPTKPFRTSLLCRLVYGVEQIEKKHRVSVLRAIRTLVSRGEVQIAGWVPRFEKDDVEWFNFRIRELPTKAFVLRPRRTEGHRGSAAPVAKLRPAAQGVRR